MMETKSVSAKEAKLVSTLTRLTSEEKLKWTERAAHDLPNHFEVGAAYKNITSLSTHSRTFEAMLDDMLLILVRERPTLGLSEHLSENLLAQAAINRITLNAFTNNSNTPVLTLEGTRLADLYKAVIARSGAREAVLDKLLQSASNL